MPGAPVDSRGLALAGLLLAGLPGCAEEHRGSYRGVYSYGFEVSAFRPCGLSTPWWATGDLAPLRTQPPPDAASVYAEVDGELSDPGQYGHLGAYPRQLEIRKVHHVSGSIPSACR